MPRAPRNHAARVAAAYVTAHIDTDVSINRALDAGMRTFELVQVTRAGMARSPAASVFCSRCGSTLPFRPLIPGVVGVPMGSVDGDPGIRPCAHIFVESKAPWFEISDSLPRNARAFDKPEA